MQVKGLSVIWRELDYTGRKKDYRDDAGRNANAWTVQGARIEQEGLQKDKWAHLMLRPFLLPLQKPLRKGSLADSVVVFKFLGHFLIVGKR